MPRFVTFVTTSLALRTAAVWASVTSASCGVGLLTLPVIAAGPTRAFTSTLTWGCAVLALLAAAGAWLVTTDVARCVLTRREARRPVGPVRAAVLLACGISLVAGPVGAQPPADTPREESDRTAARTDRGEALGGLPLPDRATSGAATTRTASRPDEAVHVVRRGDHLWGIASARLPGDATDARIAGHVRDIHEHNREVIGPDPDLVLPGQRLRLPPAPGRDA
ncbi:hypothetical protein KUV85_09080 [Nocardioides panacisoli]|uniref:LysM peptidoglycan-binding domain-containing protein n=1 Tax=Nocardioides panacisoli TaxID=627624 RepID=UPI001C62A162|nr:hypothetical protein [Nocardioides panacisoli]QYJ02492.1 hypothetical protein KUV85_09080 [Nocardioides panacisoli]